MKMVSPPLLAVLLALLSTAAGVDAAPAPPKPISVDRSNNVLIDPATAETIWEQTTSARVLRLYPKRRFRFVSEISGGFTEGRTCVVTARAMLLPLQRAAVVYAPIKSATTFDAQPSLSHDQCRELARGKLKEAIQAINASIVAS